MLVVYKCVWQSLSKVNLRKMADANLLCHNKVFSQLHAFSGAHRKLDKRLSPLIEQVAVLSKD